jgi:hypothetical protein
MVVAVIAVRDVSTDAAMNDVVLAATVYPVGVASTRDDTDKVVAGWTVAVQALRAGS